MLMERPAISQLVSTNLRRLINEKETNPHQLALACNPQFSPSAIYDMLNGRSESPKISSIATIADALNVPISSMFLTEEQVAAYSQLFEAYSRLSPEEQRRLSQVAQYWHVD